MKVTLDLDTNMMYAPKSFFPTYAKLNDKIEKLGGEKIDAFEVIKKSFEICMSDTDKYFRVKD